MLQQIQSKLLDQAAAQQRVQAWQAEGQKVVFTNGCFDILHMGHVQLLSRARGLGDKLIVGLNSSASIRRLKGPTRPINDDKSRQFVLAGLHPINAVVLFEQDTPLELIRLLQPDVLVKGGDWAVDQIVGAELVRAKGGEVHSLPFLDGYSTTNLIQQIRESE